LITLSIPDAHGSTAQSSSGLELACDKDIFRFGSWGDGVYGDVDTLQRRWLDAGERVAVEVVGDNTGNAVVVKLAADHTAGVQDIVQDSDSRKGRIGIQLVVKARYFVGIFAINDNEVCDVTIVCARGCEVTSENSLVHAVLLVKGTSSDSSRIKVLSLNNCSLASGSLLLLLRLDLDRESLK
jgi:hypothetical protein